MCAVERINPHTEGSFRQSGTSSLINDGLRVTRNLIANDVVHVAFVGQVIVRNRSLSAQYVTGERRTSSCNVIANRQVVLNRQVGGQNLTRYCELNARCA